MNPAAKKHLDEARGKLQALALDLTHAHVDNGVVALVVQAAGAIKEALKAEGETLPTDGDPNGLELVVVRRDGSFGPFG